MTLTLVVIDRWHTTGNEEFLLEQRSIRVKILFCWSLRGGSVVLLQHLGRLTK